MNQSILFLGPLYPPERESEITADSFMHISNAPNVYQWNLLKGLHTLAGERLHVINVLPVGTWKTAYKKAILKSNAWESNGVEGDEVGCLNLPFFKQLIRARKVRRLLRKRTAQAPTEVLLYSAYMPFLKAVYRLPRNVRVTAIITDLPEFYDLGQTSSFRKLLRTLQNRMIYRYLKRVDRFVVLTEQMCAPLRVGTRPWLCMEGVCDDAVREYPSSEDARRIVFYGGTLHYQYGIKNLLDAFEGLEDENTELWICGSGEAEKEITALAKRDSRVKFYGFCSQEETAALRAQASVLVNPRPNEGEYVKYSFPSKTMEYMASGKPVVAYKLDGIPEEYDAYLNYASPSVPAADGLRDALTQVLFAYDTALEKAERAREFVLKNKNGTAQAKRLLELLEQDTV